ncbi:MAG: hypothetical protein NT118_11720, partial [Lentisphaerae bacterium]|nr:hypothetical protein [Lentisphaerota bacterium]
MQVCKIGISNMKLMKENKRYVLMAQQLQKENDRIQEKLEEITQERDNLKETLARKKDELKSKDDYINKMDDNSAIVEKNKIKKDYDDLKEYTDKVRKEFDNSIRDDARFKFYLMVSQARFSEAVEMLGILSLVSVRKWNTLSINSLYAIVRDEFKDVDENVIKADIAVMVGRPGEAKNFLTNDPEVNLLCIAVYKNALDSIRYLAPGDRKKAVLKAQALYRNFGKVPGFENCREDLIAILGKDFSPDEDSKKTLPQ